MKGILVFANNNTHVDYIKQAYYLALRAKKILNLPTSVVTDSVEYLKTQFPDYDVVFDKVIYQNAKGIGSKKRYYDGSMSHKTLEFKNSGRSNAYNLSPYTETLVLDTDIIIANTQYLQCFKQPFNFLIYKEAYDLAQHRNYSEFVHISDPGIDFYWATCFFFRKTEESKRFFDLLQHIEENWPHYNTVFQTNRNVFRNDIVFSIGIHIMNGYQQGDFANPMPGKLYFTTDRDILHEIDNNEFVILVEKKGYFGEYLPIRIKNTNLHTMNKFSLNSCIDKELS
jgi:hypothetical protein